LPNADLPISIIPLPIITLARLIQSEKVEYPMLVTLFRYNYAGKEKAVLKRFLEVIQKV
jgi:hypothetical protein